jgi:hypothetical protein
MSIAEAGGQSDFWQIIVHSVDRARGRRAVSLIGHRYADGGMWTLIGVKVRGCRKSQDGS